MFIFFTRISPLVPFDADDWLFSGTMRGPYPLWGAFNPTRVLPEILDPLGGSIAAFCVYPFTKDYVGSITIVQSLITSIFVVAMFYGFFLLLVKKFKYSDNVAILSEAVFFLSFFLLFKHINMPSYTGFWTVDIACVFFYLIPGLLNALLLFKIDQSNDFGAEFNNFSNKKKGIFLALLYFALFSNSQFNIIIATTSFCLLLRSMYANKRNFFKIKYLKKAWIYLLILFTWLLTIIFDLYGERAKGLGAGNQSSMHDKLAIVLGYFKGLLSSFNKKFVVLLFLVVLFAVISMLISKNNSQKERDNFISLIIINIVSLVLSLFYLLLAYFKAIPRYAGRPDAMWPIIFYLLFIFGLSAAYLINKFSIARVISPLVIAISCFVAFNFSCPPIPSISGLTTNMTAKTAKSIDNYIIEQVVEADKDGKAKAIVSVPRGAVNDNNWPQSYYMAPALSQCLYTHHIINNRINVIFEPSLKVNKHFVPNVKSQPFNPMEK